MDPLVNYLLKYFFLKKKSHFRSPPSTAEMSAKRFNGRRILRPTRINDASPQGHKRTSDELLQEPKRALIDVVPASEMRALLKQLHQNKKAALKQRATEFVNDNSEKITSKIHSMDDWQNVNGVFRVKVCTCTRDIVNMVMRELRRHFNGYCFETEFSSAFFSLQDELDIMAVL